MFYSLPTTVEIKGREYPVRTDYRVILEIVEALNDADLTDEEKGIAALEMFYENEIPVDKEEALKQCFLFIDMGESPKKKSPRLMDWEHDFRYIIAPVNRVLGYEARNEKYLHWWTFIGAYMEIGGDCLFSQMVNMRGKLGEGKKLEKYERDWLRKNRDIVDLPQKYTERDAEMEQYWIGG